MIRLIVGLGNPGLEYAKTRHNAGFLVVDRLAEIKQATFHKNRYGLLAQWDQRFLLKPLTFMNLSGQAVGPFARQHQIAPEEIVVVSDDMDLPLGRLRIRLGGSSGGHNGLKSIMQVLGTDQFVRLKIGIGRPPQDIAVIDWVLQRFMKEDWAVLDKVRDGAAGALQTLCIEGAEAAMTRFNGKLLL
ncbi:MAG: aminoacyl-tRNA hydrolase [Firmicutes bacterium]|nr:aminoacyl-tRNA hydrolase [Bacillota bacterium]